MIPTPKKEKKLFSLSDRDSIKKQANKQEKIIAKKLGAKQTPNSGSTPFLKGDMIKGDQVMDIKSALTTNSITITVDMLVKLEQDAIRVGKIPILLLNFPHAKGLIHKMWSLQTI
jgi:hypothetical protein